jgi:PAS domain S-box-containing protein
MKQKRPDLPRWLKAAPAMTLLALLAAGPGLLQKAEGRTAGDQGRSSSQTPRRDSPIISLTEEEQAWLRGHPIIRVAQDPGWPPVEFADEQGKPSGIADDYLKLIEERLGVKFERVRGLSWQDSYARLKRWDLDMTTSVSATPERADLWAFTKPYLKVPLVILTRMDVPYVAGLRELAGKKVAVVDGYVAGEWILRDFPEIPLVKVGTVLEGLDLLKKEKVFAFIDNMLVIGYYLTKLKPANLKIVGETPYVNAQSMAVRKDWAILSGILQKALDSISETEAAAIYHKWVPIRYEYRFHYERLWPPLAALILILAGLAAWIRKLSREIRNRKEAESALKESEEKFSSAFRSAPYAITITRASDGKIIEVNDCFFALTGYTIKEVAGKTTVELDLWAYARDRDFVVSELSKGNKIKEQEFPFRKKSGESIVGLFSAEIIAIQNEKCILSSINDITERKRAEEALRESEVRYRFLMDNAQFPAVVVSVADARVLFINERASAMFGVPASNAAGLFAPDFWCRKKDLVRYVQLVKDQGVVKDFETELRSKSGVRMTVMLSSNLIEFAGQKADFTVFQDITERKRAEEAVQASLREKETLLREIHHRVKNNMQVISSLFNLQAGYIKDNNALRMLKEGQNRIRSMALIHEKLYQSPDLSKIDFAAYLRSLGAHLFQFYRTDADQVRLETDLDDVRLDINSAVPCGLLVNELISNALKHAFPAGQKGAIRIRLRRQKEGLVEIRVEDDGLGFPEAVDFRHAESFGLQIINLLVGQLEGTINLDRKTGTAFTIAFRELDYKKRI